MIPLLLASYFLLLTFLAWRHLPLAVAFTIFALPSYLIRFSIGPIPTTLLEGMILIICTAWTIKKYRNQSLVTSYELLVTHHKSIFIPIVLFFLASIIAIFVAPDLRQALGLWRAYILEPLLFFIVFLDTAHRDPQLRRNTIFALAASTFILSIIALYQSFTGWMLPYPWQEEAHRRVTGIFPYPNALALYLAPIAILLAGVILTPEKKLRVTRYALLVTILLSFLSILAAKSHGGIAAVVVGLVVIGWTTRRFRFMTIIIVLTGVALVTMHAPWRQFVLRQLTFTNPSGLVRKSQYKDTVRMFADGYWLQGTGLSGYKKTVAPYHRRKEFAIFMYPHNLFLALWTELGIVGLLSFLWLIGIVFLQTIKTKVSHVTCHMSHVALAALAALLAHGLVDVPFFKNDLAVLFWIMIALVITNSGRTEANERV